MKTNAILAGKGRQLAVQFPHHSILEDHFGLFADFEGRLHRSLSLVPLLALLASLSAILRLLPPLPLPSDCILAQNFKD